MTSSPSRASERSVDAALLRRTTELAVDFLNGLDDRPVTARTTRDALLASLGAPLADDGIPAVDVVEALAAAADPGLIAMAGPRFFGFVIGGSLPAALAADWLTSTWDQNAGLFAAGPAASVVEEVVGDWLVDLLGLPAGSSIGLATGCQMAQFTCLAAARHAVLARAGWNVEDDGLFGAPEIAVVVGSEAHATIGTALQYLGVGRTRTIVVDSDDQGRMRLDALEASLPDGDGPLIVTLQAGNVNTGSFDPIGPAIELIRARHPGAWVHVDGAFGLWAAATPAFRHLLDGHDGADSWATDGHKWLNVPYDSGFAFVRDPEQHRAAMSPPTCRIHRLRRRRTRRVQLGARVFAPSARVRGLRGVAVARPERRRRADRTVVPAGHANGREAASRGRRGRDPERRRPRPGPGSIPPGAVGDRRGARCGGGGPVDA